LKFLIKIEEAINQLILNFIEKMKHVTPHFIFAVIEWIKHSPHHIREKLAHHWPAIRLFFLKFIGYIQHYITMIRGHFVGVLIYLKSEEFKNKNKSELLLAPIKKFKTAPIKAFSTLLITFIFSAASYFIYMNAQKIVVGTKALRAPASAAVIEEPILEFKKLKYEILEKEVVLDITLVANSLDEKDKLIKKEHEIEEHLLGMHIKAAQLPISEEELKALKAEIISTIHDAKIKSVEIKQVLEGRPEYFLLMEKTISVKNLNLQLFLEDTKRNRQIWINFSALASNRNAILFLKDHEVEIRDYLNMNVEPVIPQLPIEEEGRQIIKDKVRDELNEFLKNNGIEGKILEIYVDYLMVS
jgi:flagellar basal body-associated protein FliL